MSNRQTKRPSLGTGRHTPCPSLAMAVLALGMAAAPGTSHAQTQDDHGCYGAEFAREDGPIRSIRLIPPRQPAPDEPDDVFGHDIAQITFTRWDVPGIVFDVIASSGHDDTLMEAMVECDGGRFLMSRAGDAMFLEALGVLYTPSGPLGPFLGSGDADGGRLVGLFRLDRIDTPGRCVVEADPGEVTLMAGDISTRVFEAESLLASIGYLRELPDQIFDARTEAALRAFQRDYGLTETGQIDPGTAMSLRGAAIQAGSC